MVRAGDVWRGPQTAYGGVGIMATAVEVTAPRRRAPGNRCAETPRRLKMTTPEDQDRPTDEVEDDEVEDLAPEDGDEVTGGRAWNSGDWSR